MMDRVSRTLINPGLDLVEAILPEGTLLKPSKASKGYDAGERLFVKEVQYESDEDLYLEENKLAKDNAEVSKGVSVGSSVNNKGKGETFVDDFASTLEGDVEPQSPTSQAEEGSPINQDAKAAQPRIGPFKRKLSLAEYQSRKKAKNDALVASILKSLRFITDFEGAPATTALTLDTTQTKGELGENDPCTADLDELCEN